MRTAYSFADGTPASNTVTNYISLISGQGTSGWSTTLNVRRNLIPIDGKIYNLEITLNTAPGAGKSWTFSVNKNGSATGVTVTISDTNTSGADYVNQVSIAPGDFVSLQAVPTGTPTNFTGIFWNVEFSSTIPQESFISRNNGFTANTSVTTYAYPLSNNSFTTSAVTTQDATAVSPYYATIKSFYVSIAAAPGAGNSWEFSIFKNGLQEASSVLTLSNTSTSASVSGISIAIAPNDDICYRIVPTGTPVAFAGATFSMGIIPAVTGESWFGGYTFNATDLALTEYVTLTGGNNQVWFNVESTYRLFFGKTSVILRKLIFWGFVTTTSGSYDITIRKNGADTAATVNYSSSQYVQNSVGSVVVNKGDIITFQCKPNSPDATFSSRWSFVSYIAPNSGNYSNLPLLGAG